MEEQHPVWKFFESSFTSLAAGVVIGAAIISPVYFRFAFIGGGVALLVSLIRSKFFEKRAARKRIVGNIVLCILLAAVWVFVWGKIPKPVEFPTTDQIVDAIVKKTEEPRRGQKARN